MLALGLVLNTVGIGLFCWLIFTLAVYALPFFVAVSSACRRFIAALASSARCLLALSLARSTLVDRSNRFRNDPVADLACRHRGRFCRPGRICRLSCRSRDVADRRAFAGLA